MTESMMRESVLSERIAWIKDMLDSIKKLPLDSFDSFSSDMRNPASAEFFLRRAIEALMDAGRHVLAKGFAVDVPDYKSIAAKLNEFNVLDSDTAMKMRILAGYRNRMVHFYNQIDTEELFEICSKKLDDVNLVLNSIINWIKDHPEKIDKKL